MNFHAMSSIIASSIFLPKDFHPKPIQFTAKSFLVCCLSSQFARLNFLSPSLSEIFFARDKFPETKLSLFTQDWAVHTDGNVKDFIWFFIWRQSIFDDKVNREWDVASGDNIHHSLLGDNQYLVQRRNTRTLPAFHCCWLQKAISRKSSRPGNHSQ